MLNGQSEHGNRHFLSPYFPKIFFLFILFSSSAFAKEPLKIGFIYPGGEGSPEDAQGLIHAFSEQIQKNGGPILEGNYYPDRELGLAALRSQKLPLAIVSLDFFLAYSKKHRMEILLSTLPLKSNGAHEEYYLMGLGRTLSFQELPKIFISYEVSDSFVKRLIFGKEIQTTLEQTSNILSVLKKLAEREIQGAVLLDSYEYTAWNNLNMAWGRDIGLLYQAPRLPSSPLVALIALDEKTKENLTRAFVNLNQTVEGRAVLESLRLRGFQKPNKTDYEEALKNLSQPMRAEPTMPAKSPN